MTLQCPPFNDFCAELNAKCPSDCNGHGLCTNGNQCSCYTGWSGSDCGSKYSVDYATITAGSFSGSGKSAAVLPLAAVLFALTAALQLAL